MIPKYDVHILHFNNKLDSDANFSFSMKDNENLGYVLFGMLHIFRQKSSELFELIEKLHGEEVQDNCWKGELSSREMFRLREIILDMIDNGNVDKSSINNEFEFNYIENGNNLKISEDDPIISFRRFLTLFAKHDVGISVEFKSE